MKKDNILVKNEVKSPSKTEVKTPKKKASKKTTEDKFKNLDLSLHEISARVEKVEIDVKELYEISVNMDKIVERVKERMGL